MFSRTHLFVLMAVLLSALSCRPRDERGMNALKAFSDAHAVPPRVLAGAPVLGEVALTDNRNVMGGLPQGEAAIDDDKTLIVSRPQFVVAFNTSEKIPRWTAWQVGSNDIGNIARDNEFKSDEILNQYLELAKHDLGVTPEDYTNTCFDRGHQSPSKDRSHSPLDNKATFFMSNMAPQTAFLNRGIWASFEAYTRTLVQEGKRLQMIAGPILKDGRERIGPNKDIAVPESFFKLVMVFGNERSTQPESYLAVIMPNVTANGLDPLANREKTCAESTGSRTGTMSKDWKTYKVTVAEVEAKTRMKFPNLGHVTYIK